MSADGKIVLVSGCFDLLHVGHVAFLKTAARFGKVYVGVGSDQNIQRLKGKAPVFSQEERAAMVRAVRYVEDAFVNAGSGILDFEPDLVHIRPDVLVVNTDGHSPDKQTLCKKYGVEYKVLDRVPDPGMPARSSSETKRELRFPYRVCIAGGWIDQPWVSVIHPGSVVVAQMRPTMDFNDRSGLATSSRKVAVELWGDRLPQGDPQRNAKLLFGAENPPGTKYVSGSQDHLGLLMPGINRLVYGGDYWPHRIESCTDAEACEWMSRILKLVPLEPRPAGYDPLTEKHLEKEWIKALGESGDRCWECILRRDLAGFGKAITQTLLGWRKILPCTVPDWVMDAAEPYLRAHAGAVPSGCGGGYLLVASEKEIDGAVRIRIRY